MARGGDSRLGMWQVLLTVSMVLITPLSAHGRHSLAGGSRKHHHHHHNNNQSSVSKEAFGARTTALSDDSAERDHLIGLGAGLPHSSSHHHSHKQQQHARLDFEEEDLPAAGEELTAGGGAGPDQPGNPLSDDVITVEFHSPAPDTVPSDTVPSDDPADWPRVPVPQKQKAGGGGGGGGDPTAWTLSDFYDYLAPDDDLSALDTTPEPEPSPSPPPNMEDENPLLAGSPDNTKSTGGGSSRMPAASAPGPGGPDKGQGLGLGGGALGPDGCMLGFVRSEAGGVCVSQCDADPNFCYNGGVCTAVAGQGAFCRCNVQEYIWNKGTRCDWMVTEFQVLCAVVGVATVVLLLLFMIIVFFSKRLHRLKNENRRLRKRSKYRPQSGEPQTDGMSLSTTAEGSQPNVRKLCDTPPQPPPQAHAHNLAYYDNIICQDDPQKQLVEDPVKTPTAKEEESMNIRNSHSPKQENNRPLSVNMSLGGHTPGHTPVDDNTEENDEDGVTIDLELLLPKEVKLRQATSPPLQYDVFLYKTGTNGESGASPGSHAPPPNNMYHPSSHPVPKSPKTPKKSPKASKKSPKAPKSPKSPKAPKSPKSPKAPKSPKQRVQNHSPNHRQPRISSSSPGRHSMNGCYSSPHARHPSPSPRRSSSQHRGQPSSSSPSTPAQLRRPRGRSQAPDAGSQHWDPPRGGGVAVNMRPSPSSPHLTPESPPPSPSRVRFGHVSTRSLPPLY